MDSFQVLLNNLTSPGKEFALGYQLGDQMQRATIRIQHLDDFITNFLNPAPNLTDNDKFYIHVYIMMYNPSKWHIN